MTKKRKTPATYIDGVGADRCTQCGAMLRHGNEPMVYLRRADVESLIRILNDVMVPPSLLTRLEQAVGRTWRQIEEELNKGKA